MSILHFKIQILEQFGSSRETNVKGSRVTSIEHQRPFMLLKKLRKKERNLCFQDSSNAYLCVMGN